MQHTDDFQNIKDNVDIKQEIERRTGQTAKQEGSSYSLSECPFCSGHDCFKITPAKYIFNCFQCDAPTGGSIIDFVKKQKQCSEREALEDLAEVHGIELKSMAPGAGDDANSDPIKIQIFEVAADYYHNGLMTTKHALSYQNKVRKHDNSTLKTFRVGYTDGNLHRQLTGKDFTKDQQIASGLVAERDGALQDFFWPRQYIYPHVGKSGKIGDFTTKQPGGKSLQLRTEYKEPDCPFYNMQAFKGNAIILVEGENDVLSVYGRGGSKNVAACNGQLSNHQVKSFKGWVETGQPKKVILCFDNDPGGKKYQKTIKEALVDLCLSDEMISINRRFVSRQRGQPGADQCEEEVETRQIVPEARSVKLKVIKFNEKVNDIDELLKGEAKPADTMRALMENAVVCLMPLRRMLAIYRYWCSLMDIKARANEIGEIIFDYLLATGQYYIDGDKCYLFYKGKTFEIGSNMPFKSMFYGLAGLNYADSQTKQVLEVLQAKAYEFGRHTRVPGWIYTDREKQTVYYNLANDKNEIAKISPGKIEIVLNGMNSDKILLNSSPKMLPMVYLLDVDKRQAMRLFWSIFMKNLACDASDTFFIAALLMNTILIQYTKARGISKFSGISGSAKTGAAAMFTTLIYGQDCVTIGSTAADFSEATRSPVIVKDNLEADTMNTQQRDFLLVAGTGITKEKRKAGTDSDNVYERVCTQVIVTAIEPFFKGELLSRTTDIIFDAKYFDPDFVEATEVEAKLIAARDMIWSAFFKIIAHDVLPGFNEKRKAALSMLKEKYVGHSKSRLNELYSCLFILCGELLKYIPHPVHSVGQKSESIVQYLVLDDWIDQQDRIDRASAGDTNQILYRLELLLKEYLRNQEGFREAYQFECRHIQDNKGDIIEVRFILSTSELFSAFELLAKSRGGKCPYQNTRQLGARLNDSIKVLEADGWSFQPKIKTVRGYPKHAITKIFPE